MPNQRRVPAAYLAITLLLVGCSGVGAPTATSSSAASAPAATINPTASATSVTPSASASAAAERMLAHIDVAGLTRNYAVVAPPDVADRGPLPLLLVLHGAGLTMAKAELITGYDQMATDPGAVVVYPQGVNNAWNAGAKDTGVDDVAFISSVIDRMEAGYPIDANRVFILGGSNGGQMAYRFACEHPDRVAAVADVVGALLVDCNPTQPVSVIDIHGTADTMVPPEGGGDGCLPMQCPPLADTMERWRQIDGCSGDPSVTEDSHTIETTWTACQGGTAVTFIMAIGKWHEWYTSNPDDRAVTWDFFMNHPRTAGAT